MSIHHPEDESLIVEPSERTHRHKTPLLNVYSAHHGFQSVSDKRP
jgi:hypothetical protein